MSRESDEWLAKHPEAVLRNEKLPDATTKGKLWKAQKISDKRKRPWRKGARAQGLGMKHQLLKSLENMPGKPPVR